MSERFSILFSLPQNLYATGSPAIIAAGSLLKDNQTGKILAQIKFQNISTKTIRAITVSIIPLDLLGSPLGTELRHQYLDLHAARDDQFGQKEPIIFPDSSARSFSVSISDVIFSDNSLWTAADSNWKPLSAPVPLTSALHDLELVKQYRITYGDACKFAFKAEKDLWRCSCGALNHQSEAICHSCMNQASALAAVDMDALSTKRDERLNAEHKKREAEQKELEARTERQKKNLKTGVLAAVIIAVLGTGTFVFTQILLPQNNYKKAEELLASGEYDKAIDAFEALGGYKDSAERALQIPDMQAYDIATKLLDAGDYDGAIAAFEELGDYKDSAELMQLASYQRANALLADGDYANAAAAFAALGDYADSPELAKEANYNYAQMLLDSGDIPHAAMTFGQLADFKDARKRSFELWDQIAPRSYIDCGISTAGLKADGTVIVTDYTGTYDYSFDVSSWNDILSIATSYDYLLGLKSDGTVLVSGDETTVPGISEWTDIVAVECSQFRAIGLRSDGTVVSSGTKFTTGALDFDVSDWSDIIAVACGNDFAAGLRSDGTVVATGDNYSGACNVSDWTDITAIACGPNYTIGLKSDGTVIATGNNENGQCNIDLWTDITAISCDGDKTVGLKSNGTVVATTYTGPYIYYRCDVSGWSNISAIACGHNCTVGLRSDGTVVATGDAREGGLAVSGWTLKTPD